MRSSISLTEKGRAYCDDSCSEEGLPDDDESYAPSTEGEGNDYAQLKSVDANDPRINYLWGLSETADTSCLLHSDEDSPLEVGMKAARASQLKRDLGLDDSCCFK